MSPRLLGPSVLLAAVPTLVRAAPQPDGRGAHAPDRPYDILALHLDITVEPDQGIVRGTARYTARPLHAGPLVLDRVDVDITAVRGIDTAAPPHRVHPGHLVIDATTEHLGEDGTLDVEIDFVAHPWTGAHFRGAAPADSYPEVWTQGEQIDHRHWFPAYDHPNERFDYTGTVHAPDGWRAVTNSGHDLPTYLIMFAAGPYDEHVHATDPTTRVWVPPGTDPTAVAAVLDPIPAMKAHFEARTGTAYPWGDYLQVFVQRFLYFGMENTGATINSARALVHKSVQQTRPRNETLIAHELAHQWFGDLLTCETWRDLWLNEGFATFMTGDYIAERQTTPGERDALWAEMVMRWYDRSREQPEPMARRWHHGPGADSYNVYNRGAATLQMLRAELGEDAFWTAIRTYVTDNAHGSVETTDLRRAFESVSGRDLRGFFQQWTETAGSPTLDVSDKYDGEELVVTVRQQTKPDRPLFHVPVEVQVGTASGVLTRTAWMDRSSLQLRIPTDQPPQWVAIDPRGAVLATWKHKQSTERLEAQALLAPPFARLQAMTDLAETDASDALQAILHNADEPLPYRVAAANALGEQRVAGPLVAATRTDLDLLRMEVARALGKCPGEASRRNLIRLVRTDLNPDVQGAALLALASVAPEDAVQLARKLTRLAGQENFGLVYSALDVLGTHGEARDLDLLTDSRLPLRNRPHGITNAARWVQSQPDPIVREKYGPRVARAAESILTDLDLRTRQSAVSVLHKVGDTDSIAALEAHRRATRVDTEQQASLAAITAIRARTRPDYVDPSAKQAARLDALEERLKALEGDVEKWSDHH